MLPWATVATEVWAVEPEDPEPVERCEAVVLGAEGGEGEGAGADHTRHDGPSY